MNNNLKYIRKHKHWYERTFLCANCGHTDDRDIHATNNMIWLYRWNKDNADKAGTVYTDKKLVTSKLVL